MPLTFAEIASWTVDDVNTQILLILPKGWTFDLQTHPDHWRAAFKSERGIEVWSTTHYELRLLLLSAYAYIWQSRNGPSSVHPAWRPKEGPKLVPVRQAASQHPIPDPQSLDPAYVRSVYAEWARKRGKENG